MTDEDLGPSLQLGALTGLAVIEVRQGDRELGTRILRSIISHPQVSPEIEELIRLWSNRLNLDLGQVEDGKQIDIQELVKMLDV